MARHVSQTPATKMLAEHGVDYTEHVFAYVEHGGTQASSSSLGLPEHQIVKTLIMQDEKKSPLVVLMHGDRKVSTKNLARTLGVKNVEACAPAVAERHSGYQVGGTSPFGLRKSMPIYVERSVLELERIYLNGGRRGYLVGIAPSELVRVLAAQPVEVAIAR